MDRNHIDGRLLSVVDIITLMRKRRIADLCMCVCVSYIVWVFHALHFHEKMKIEMKSSRRLCGLCVWICPRIFLLSRCENVFTSESRLAVSIRQVLTIEVDAQQILSQFVSFLSFALTTHTQHMDTKCSCRKCEILFNFCMIILCLSYIVPCNSVFLSLGEFRCQCRQSAGDYTIPKRMVHHLSMNFDAKNVSDIHRKIITTAKLLHQFIDFTFLRTRACCTR